MPSEVLGDDLQKILPIIREGGSDTAIFDNVLELLVMSGRSLPHALLMMIPEPWQGDTEMSPARKAFYEYHSSLMEPWDGPASIAFTDGTVIGAVLDRNGLRPSRYYVTKDDLVIMASEVGVLDVPPEQVADQRTAAPRPDLPGRHGGRAHRRRTMRSRRAGGGAPVRRVARGAPDQHRRSAAADPTSRRPITRPSLQRQAAFGYTQEDLRLLLGPMASAGEEPIGSMGTDTPLAVLSERPRLLYDYFKQLFAQVTNPPLDAIREELVTSMESTIGPERNLLWPEPKSCRQITVKYPILDNQELAKLRHVDAPGFHSMTLADAVPPGGGRPRPRARVGRTQGARARGGPQWTHDPHPVRPRRERGMGGDSQPAGDGRRCTIIWFGKARARGAPSSSNPATRARCTTWRSSSGTGPAR